MDRAHGSSIKPVSGGYYDNYLMALLNKKGELVIPVPAVPPRGQLRPAQNDPRLQAQAFDGNAARYPIHNCL
jgi:hypothetical protein